MSLDDSLAAWAATVRLPDTAAADIYQRIVTAPAPDRRAAGTRIAQQVSAGLDPAWWRHFTADFAAQMITSSRPPAWAR